MRKNSTIKIGKNLQRIRKSYGYTQERVAEEIECSARYISDVLDEEDKDTIEHLITYFNNNRLVESK